MDGKHYIYTSGTTSYTPNPSEVAVFDDYHGEYTVLGNPHIGDEYAHSFCSQITSVIKIPGRIFMWLWPIVGYRILIKRIYPRKTGSLS